jgi:hypothetical protein
MCDTGEGRLGRPGPVGALVTRVRGGIPLRRGPLCARSEASDALVPTLVAEVRRGAAGDVSRSRIRREAEA